VVRGTTGKFDPQEVTKEYAKLCRDYHVSRVTGDNYAGQWVADAWRKAGLEYLPSRQPRGEIYLECLPAFTRGLVRLPDHARLVRELRLLERQTHRSGKDKVEHPKNGHDDHANVVCGGINLIAQAARLAANELNIHPPIFGGTPRNIPGQNYGVGAGETAPLPSAAPPVGPAGDFRNYVDGVYVGPGQKYWGLV
jgi:hypothetical protein